MECGVCIGGDDSLEMGELSQNDMVVARKPHKCCECHREIAKGSRYERISGKWDGEFSAYKTCLDCVEIRYGLSCGPVGLGNLWYEIAECDVFANFNTGCLEKIKTASAKAYFLERWSKWKGLSK